MGLRFWRITRRTAQWWGRTRPDLPEGCPEQLSQEFYRYIWRTRRTGRDACARMFARARPDQSAHHLRGASEVRAYLGALGQAMKAGSLGLPHR